ncbi:hypothetical protein OPV22_024361 [Ensete ventricosum]|uniref:Uncharacterized protein n=1 Tax=Ensete ventricosum TaxID=4639 RepID=A0AAV8QK55_ENSVE|nr:hypothetical protein OPV22_024361 [Ensete ventricosum]
MSGLLKHYKKVRSKEGTDWKRVENFKKSEKQRRGTTGSPRHGSDIMWLHVHESHLVYLSIGKDVGPWMMGPYGHHWPKQCCSHFSTLVDLWILLYPPHNSFQMHRFLKKERIQSTS